LFDALPPGIRLEHERIYVDVQKLLETRGFGQYLGYVKELEVHTVEGALVVSLRASITH
jgi:hypothetical protein